MSSEPITCEEVIEQIYLFLDQELDSTLSDRINEHLERCRDCFSRAEFEKRLRARVREAQEAEAPEHLHRRLQRVLNEF